MTNLRPEDPLETFDYITHPEPENERFYPRPAESYSSVSYWLFGWGEYEAMGGMRDFLKEYATLEEAQADEAIRWEYPPNEYGPGVRYSRLYIIKVANSRPVIGIGWKWHVNAWERE